MPLLQVVVTSTREGRAGDKVAHWFVERARTHGGFEVKVTDLKELALPLLDEPEHPRKQKYQNPHTKAWSAIVDAADAFVFVIPEYNYGMPPALLNAIDYVYKEWNYKPAAFVSYGGLSGGTRSAQMAKQVLTSVKVMPIPEAVAITYFGSFLPELPQRFEGTDAHAQQATVMLDELARWTKALRSLRAKEVS